MSWEQTRSKDQMVMNIQAVNHWWGGIWKDWSRHSESLLQSGIEKIWEDKYDHKCKSNFLKVCRDFRRTNTDQCLIGLLTPPLFCNQNQRTFIHSEWSAAESGRSGIKKYKIKM